MQKYLITDPSFYNSNTILEIIKTKNPDYICLRDKTTNNYKNLATEFKKIIKNINIKDVLHTDYKLAYELGCYGVHLPSIAFDDIQKAKALDLKVIVSTHSLEEALHVEKLGADYITFSPIFYTPNKGIPKGLEKLKEINDKINIRCFALGGIIDDEQINSCAKIGTYGFASIRYFTK